MPIGHITEANKLGEQKSLRLRGGIRENRTVEGAGAATLAGLRRCAQSVPFKCGSMRHGARVPLPRSVASRGPSLSATKTREEGRDGGTRDSHRPDEGTRRRTGDRPQPLASRHPVHPRHRAGRRGAHGDARRLRCLHFARFDRRLSPGSGPQPRASAHWPDLYQGCGARRPAGGRQIVSRLVV